MVNKTVIRITRRGELSSTQPLHCHKSDHVACLLQTLVGLVLVSDKSWNSAQSNIKSVQLTNLTCEKHTYPHWRTERKTRGNLHHNSRKSSQTFTHVLDKSWLHAKTNMQRYELFYRVRPAIHIVYDCCLRKHTWADCGSSLWR